MAEAEQLPAHLEARYGIEVAGQSRLDRGVFQISRRDGPDWVARVFPPERPSTAVEEDAQILRALAEAGFPAERLARPDAVSTLDNDTVLVTEFVAGVKAEPRARTYAILGALLGRLHLRSGASLRSGGAWHHLSPQGGPADEIAAALALLDRATPARGLDRLRHEIEQVDDCADLPHAFVHPDFVPANAISTADNSLVIIDWAGSGQGPRLWSLGFLLWAAGAGDLRLVDWVVSRYRRHSQLNDAELDRLPAAVRARSLMIDSWSVGHGYKAAAAVMAALGPDNALAERIADRAREAFAVDPDEGTTG